MSYRRILNERWEKEQRYVADRMTFSFPSRRILFVSFILYTRVLSGEDLKSIYYTK